jgi:hypothetical protein
MYSMYRNLTLSTAVNRLYLYSTNIKESFLANFKTPKVIVLVILHLIISVIRYIAMHFPCQVQEVPLVDFVESHFHKCTVIE